MLMRRLWFQCFSRKVTVGVSSVCECTIYKQMAKVIVMRLIGANLLRFNLRSSTRSLASGLAKSKDSSLTPRNEDKDTTTHTGQVMQKRLKISLIHGEGSYQKT